MCCHFCSIWEGGNTRLHLFLINAVVRSLHPLSSHMYLALPYLLQLVVAWCCAGTWLCQARGMRVTSMGMMLLPHVLPHHVSASSKACNVQAHKLSLKQQRTQGRGEQDNSSYNESLLNKAFFSWICSVFLYQHAQGDRGDHSIDIQELIPTRTQKHPRKSCWLNVMRWFFLWAVLE